MSAGRTFAANQPNVTKGLPQNAIRLLKALGRKLA